MTDWGTATVGLAGIAATLAGTLTANWTAGRERQHKEELAREERRQTRLADAYVEVLKIAEGTGQWAQLVRPAFDSDPPRVPPPLPELEQQAKAQVLLLAFGSSAVVEAFENWRQTVRRIIQADQLIGLRLRRNDGGDEWLELENLHRPAERAARRELADLMATELGASGRASSIG